MNETELGQSISTKTPRRSATPKHQRGYVRVEEILKAAALEFMEHGFRAATMTNIAAKSGTAIGSLYRFFPRKFDIAAALVARYTNRLSAAISALADRAGQLDAAGIANALCDVYLDLRQDRAAALYLAEIVDADSQQLAKHRIEIRAQFVRLLKELSVDDALVNTEAAITTLQHLVRGLIIAAQDDEKGATSTFTCEARRSIQLYIEGISKYPRRRSGLGKASSHGSSFAPR